MDEAWKKLSTDAYDAALLLLQNERWRSMISRAYYAVFARATALLVVYGAPPPNGREGHNHAKLAALIIDHLGYLGDQRFKIAAWVKTLYYDLRLKADYHPSASVDKGDARDALSLMRNACRDLKEPKYDRKKRREK